MQLLLREIRISLYKRGWIMGETNDMRILPVRPGAALAVVSLVAGILSFLTARECHHNLELHGINASFTPSLLYGSAVWLWWIIVTILLWNSAMRWSAVLKPSARTIAAQVGLSCALAATHLFLMQHAVWFASSHWPAWGSHYMTHGVEDIEHFGIEIILYGFIYGICAFLYSRMQTQSALIQKLDVERQLSEAQLKALQMQMEPHFLFNTLNAISSLVTQGRNQEANKTLSHLNAILRTTLRRRAPEKVPFTEELRVVESYLAIQRVRFADRLEIRIDASPEAMSCLIPSFLLQPLVENAVQHGIAPSEVGGMIETHAKRVGNALWLRVRDTGLGAEAPVSTGHGIGMENTKERLAYFYPGTHVFTAGPIASGGYEVNIQIPYEQAVTM
jgi:hypothetical protein